MSGLCRAEAERHGQIMQQGSSDGGNPSINVRLQGSSSGAESKQVKFVLVCVWGVGQEGRFSSNILVPNNPQWLMLEKPQ